MKRLWSLFAALLLANAAAAQNGVPPRPACNDYPAHDTSAGASLVPADQVAKVFSNSISRDYIVIEFAVCPSGAQPLDLASLDFALNNGADYRAFPATPEEAAWHGRKPTTFSSQGPRVVSQAGIVVGSRIDPATGRTDHGVATYGDVGIDTRPGSPGIVEKSTAGYLYFPKASAKKPKGGAWGLEFSFNGARKELLLPLK